MDRERISPKAEVRGGTLVRKALVCVVVTLVVAALGASVGWLLGGGVALGALFGALIGLWGYLRSGYAISEPNVVKPF